MLKCSYFCLFLGLKLCFGSCLEKATVQKLGMSVSSLAEYIKHFTGLQDAEVNLLKTKICDINTSIQVITGKMENLDVRQSAVENRMGILEVSHEQVSEEFQGMRQTMNDHEERITNLEENITSSKTEVSSSHFYTPGRAQHFQGREDELQFLKDNLSPTRKGCHVISICGVGGNGKSTLAAEFCFRERAEYPGGVFWFTVDNDSYFETSVNTLAYQIGIHVENFEEKLDHVLLWLGERKFPWILVIDNLDELTARLKISDSMNMLINGSWKNNCIGSGSVIITTRRNSNEMLETVADLRVNDCLELNCFSISEGVSFLVDRTGRCDGLKDAEELVQELGGLPLALEQAAAHMAHLKDVSFSSYLKHYKQKKMKFLNRKEAKPIGRIPPEKLAVRYTWMINFEYIRQMSAEYGYGKAAATVMQVAGYLGPDDIPVEIINKGDPLLDSKDLPDCLDSELGQKEILEILTKFSLFQYSKNDDSECVLSVHRLIQEVIRTTLSEHTDAESMLRKVLVDAIRLVNGAFKNVTTPEMILKGSADTSLNLLHWNKIANHCNHLLEHIGSQSKEFPNLEENITIREEFVDILHSLKIYNSIHGRQRIALDCQEHLLKIIPKLKFSEEEVKDVLMNRCSKFLLNDEQRNLLISKIHPEKKKTPKMSKEEKDEEATRLKEEGNRAFKGKHYDLAVELYTKALNFVVSEEIKRDLYQNRSVCLYYQELYIRSLQDAYLCIKSAFALGNADQKLAKGYRRRAYAWLGVYKDYQNTKEEVETCDVIAGEQLLIEYGYIFGNINATLATHFFPTFADEMKTGFTPLLVKVLSPSIDSDLGEFMKKSTNTIYILKEGTYFIKQSAGSYWYISQFACFIGYPGEAINLIIECPTVFAGPTFFQNIKISASNVSLIMGFNKTNSSGMSSAIFQMCQMKGGRKDDENSCLCGNLCLNPQDCPAFKASLKSYHQTYQQLLKKNKLSEIQTNPAYKERAYWKEMSRQNAVSDFADPGYPLIDVSFGNVLCQHCEIEGGPSGGPLVSGKASNLFVKECNISCFKLSGIEARKGGSLIIVNSKIYSNEGHGVLAGPDGKFVRIESNEIFDNSKEGILIPNDHYANDDVCIVQDNVIHHNCFGISARFSKTLLILNNKIFSNNIWGIFLRNLQLCNVTQNDIHQNLCGGIRITCNTSKNVVVAKNDIHDHTGPAFLATPAAGLTDYESRALDPRDYSTPVYMLNNSVAGNDIIRQKTSDYGFSLPDSCNYCNNQNVLLRKCAKCSKTQYCSKPCQTSDWKLRHRLFCKLYCGIFEHRIDLESSHSAFKIGSRTFHPEVQGIGKGPKPDIDGKIKFLVKIQAGDENAFDGLKPSDPHTVTIYDKSLTVDEHVTSEFLFTFVRQCGVLCAPAFYSKKVYCWAKIRNKNFRNLTIYLDLVADPQTW